MTLDLDHLTNEELDRVGLADIAETLLARDPGAFRKALRAVDKKKLAGEAQAFEKLWGWKPPALLSEWRAVEQSVDLSDSDACWTAADRSLGLDLPLELPSEERGGAFLAGYCEAFFGGLFKIGEAASGDTALVFLGPTAAAAPVLAIRHERPDVGEGRALKSYLVDVALSENDPEEGEAPGWVGERYAEIEAALSTYDAGISEQVKEARELYERSRWTARVLAGKESPRLAQYLSRAPDITTWDRELSLVESEPFRLNYWLVAHVLLGNDADATRAAQLAIRSPAAATRWLGELALATLAGTSPQFGLIPRAQLSAVRESIRRAAPAALLRS